MSTEFHTDGLTIAAQQDGTRGGFPILLLHGLSASKETYDEVVADLDQSLEIHRLDFRGHGESSRAPGTYETPFYAADVAAYISEVIGRPAMLAGHSLGGVVTHYLMQHRPELVLAAFEEDPPLFFCDHSLFEASMFANIFPLIEQEARALRDRGASVDEVADVVRKAPSPRGGVSADYTSPAMITARAISLTRGDPGVWEPAIKGGALRGYDPLGPVSRPLTVLRADPALGPALSAEQADRLRAAVPSARVILVEGATHGIHTETPTYGAYMDHLRHAIAAVA